MKQPAAWFAALALGAVLTACLPAPGQGEGEGGPTMAAGQDCLACHSGGEHAFTAAGTVFSNPDDPTSAGVSGVTVLITDALGKQVTLQSNSVGNFFTDTSLTFPIHAEFHRGSSVARMVNAVGSGSCASCHLQPPQNGAPGRPFVGP